MHGQQNVKKFVYNGYQTENVNGKSAQHARSNPVEIGSGIVCILQLKLDSGKSF